jgi:general stress protein 26
MKEPDLQPTKERLWRIVQDVNRICREGKGFDRLAPLFHDRMVMVLPGMDRRAEGKAACLRCYEDACSKMVIHRLDASQERIDLWDDTAVVAYRYDCVWDWQGKTLTDEGREILVFVREEADWTIAWRTLIPGSRRIQESDRASRDPSDRVVVQSEAERSARQVCLDLMRTSLVCHLTTIDAGGFPDTTAMNNLRCAKEYPSLAGLFEGSGNEFLVYVSTTLQSDKVARVQANPKASVFFCDPGQVIGLMLAGRIEVVTDPALKKRIWQQGWTMYYPNGPEGPEYGVLRLAPAVVKGWLQGRPFEFKGVEED